MTSGLEKTLIGTEAKKARRQAIKEKIAVVTGNPKWKKAFVAEYPVFNSLVGANLLRMGTLGRTDDQALLSALTEWIPQVIETQPDWFKKQNHLFINK
tara:strand:+ start:122 stop:415 length:294 start_codon:yes stop_codon:yes gene_type:complete